VIKKREKTNVKTEKVQPTPERNWNLEVRRMYTSGRHQNGGALITLHVAQNISLVVIVKRRMTR
jgi:hypothetical protein